MRGAFVEAVENELARDARALFITGDLGFNALEHLVAKYGRRFINAGVAEQSMMGLAAGTALTGLRPWVYSIAPFATYRCLEQIRNDVCLHRLPVRIVGNGGGYTYGIMGVHPSRAGRSGRVEGAAEHAAVLPLRERSGGGRGSADG